MKGIMFRRTKLLQQTCERQIEDYKLNTSQHIIVLQKETAVTLGCMKKTQEFYNEEV